MIASTSCFIRHLGYMFNIKKIKIPTILSLEILKAKILLKNIT